MVDLLLGSDHTDYRADLEHHITDYDAYEELANIDRMRHIVDRLRAQTIHIVNAYKRWRRGYAITQHPLERRYLSYEGILCKQDLRQHWTLYRFAMADLHAAMDLQLVRGRKPLTDGDAAKNASKKVPRKRA